MITTESKGPKAVPEKEPVKEVSEPAKPVKKAAKKPAPEPVNTGSEDSTKKSDPQLTPEDQLKGIA